MTYSTRTLFLTKQLPYPPMGGAALRNWQNINMMKAFGPVAVFSIANPPQEIQGSMTHPPGVAQWKNHAIADALPVPSLLQKIRRRLNPRSHYLMDIPYRDAIRDDLDRMLAQFQPDLVIFEELWLYRYLPIVKQYGARVILDEHNIEAPLMAGHEPSTAASRRKLQLNKLKAIESDFIRQADRVWVCSEAETALLKETYGRFEHVSVVPNGINVHDYATVRSGQRSSPRDVENPAPTLLFAASFSYQPNQVAAQLLIEQIFPKVQQSHPDAQLILVGKYPTPEMLRAAQQNSGIVVTGLVEDVKPYLAIADIIVIPLLHGGGTRLKILEAFAAGRPVVSTTKGAEGLKVQDGQQLLIRDTVEEIVTGIADVWASPSLRARLSEQAFEFVKAQYSWEAVGRRAYQELETLLSLENTSPIFQAP